MYLDRFSYNPIELAIFEVVKNKLHKYLVLWYCTYLRTYLPKKNGDGWVSKLVRFRDFESPEREKSSPEKSRRRGEGIGDDDHAP